MKFLLEKLLLKRIKQIMAKTDIVSNIQFGIHNRLT